MIEASLLDSITRTELEALHAKHGQGELTPAQLSQTRVAIGSLHVAPLVFQPRNAKDKPWDKERHVANLTKIVKQQESALDPIVVFPIGGLRIVVDGHCRLEAYKRAGLRSTTQIPVKHLRKNPDGTPVTFEDALRQSAASNSKDKLPLSYWEKAEKAWQLLQHNESRGSYTQREISRDTGISKGTIAKMQIRLRRDDAETVATMLWKDVLKLDRGDNTPAYDEDWEEKTAQDWAERLRKTFGDKPNAQPVVWQRALEIAYKWDDGDELETVEIGEGERQESSDF